MEATTFYFVMPQKYQFKVKDSEIKPYQLFLGNILKYFAVDNMIKNRIKCICSQFFY